jgi:pimeloyl-ACP methyl ester carboxylesterase
MIAALIRALGLEKPLLVGHSMGGAVSLALALRHPDTVRGLA